jgi:4'-phosphopantetheinyl transferase
VLSTSLSHAGHRAVAIAINRTGPVGVDLEEASRATAMAEIAEQVCHPLETAGLACMDVSAANEAMLAIWVRKEAFLKAAGIGLQREMRTFAAPDKALLRLPDGRWSRTQILDAGRTWMAAVSSDPAVPLTCAWVHPPSH